ncbi:aldehyde ferredoxin oxidoreductase N-terminal domain-containing protein [Romboutsia sp.]|uniref:aldehyde ferredoxin oxidoreductase N-terminal domain-containing protein n=1 Tax=Romboutsia sp. TaxID=1965302 RepID=UPI003F3EAC38
MSNALYINLNNKEIYINEFQRNSLNENDLVFTASRLAGYGIVGLNRIKVYCDDKETTCGGYFAHQLRCNGYDYIVIRGKSEEPVYLYINKEEVALKNGKNLWGKEPDKVRNILYKELNSKDIEVAQIGISSEMSVDFSKILIGNNRTCGKNGIGKIMGEKKLKAISLKRHETLKSKNKNEVNEINKKILKSICDKKIEYYFDENNSCYGCCLNCKSTSVKKISKYITNSEECSNIDKICNNYVVDSIIVSKYINEYRKINQNVDVEVFIKDIIYSNKCNSIVSEVKKSKKKSQSVNYLHKELEEIGFCKFLVDKEILTLEDLEKLKEITRL